MKIDKEFVTKIADLSMLTITESEIPGYVEDMSSILRYMDQLREVDVSEVESTNQVTGLHNVFRTDIPHEYPENKRVKLLREVPVMDNGYVVVPRTV
ncbi:MAG: Asp-tRNA(Asn)/Glu-tRNA(Gln) amidotransferase subunit GatC [Candidatus Uhrbacteria bacterium]|nr:Asp-tRNA(Asn)/Glu-tRNA(Gln) amidotransferase subunit GatC [Patescibacteria group bacterium]MBU1907230.1 Asp-tRNA(Asn)/Glu-tRNA(Gln) amidotransferase subunit GatC [Patescibacteria group bacterium]